MTYLSPYKNRLNTLGFGNLDKQLDSIFGGLPSFFDLDHDSFFSVSSGGVKTRWYEKDDAYLVRMDLPGVKKGDISLELEDGVLSVTASRSYESTETDDKSEAKSSFTYRKSIEVPETIKEDKIEATYEDGVLSLTLPKGEKAKPRQIKVEFGK